MAGRGRKSELAALKRPGDKGTIKKTKSGKFQPQIFVNSSGGQRALGSFATAEEAAAVLAAANDKLKNDEPIWDEPVKKQAAHGPVRCPRPHSALHMLRHACCAPDERLLC